MITIQLGKEMNVFGFFTLLVVAMMMFQIFLIPWGRSFELAASNLVCPLLFIYNVSSII